MPFEDDSDVEPGQAPGINKEMQKMLEGDKSARPTYTAFQPETIAHEHGETLNPVWCDTCRQNIVLEQKKRIRELQPGHHLTDAHTKEPWDGIMRFTTRPDKEITPGTVLSPRSIDEYCDAHGKWNCRDCRLDGETLIELKERTKQARRQDWIDRGVITDSI